MYERGECEKDVACCKASTRKTQWTQNILDNTYLN